MKSKTEFKHEALVEADDIQAVLEALAKGVSKGKMEFADGKDSEMELNPKGLLRLKVSASEDDGRQQFEVKVSWEKRPKSSSKTPLKIKS